MEKLKTETNPPHQLYKCMDKIKRLFTLNAWRIIVSLIILGVSFLLMQPLFSFYKPEANPPTPYVAYFFAVVFAVNVFYLAISTVYTIVAKIENHRQAGVNGNIS